MSVVRADRRGEAPDTLLATVTCAEVKTRHSAFGVTAREMPFSVT